MHIIYLYIQLSTCILLFLFTFLFNSSFHYFVFFLFCLCHSVALRCFCDENKSLKWSESGEKSAQIKHSLQANTAPNKYVAGFQCERQQKMDGLRTCILQITMSWLSFFLQKSFYLSHQLLDWSSVDYLWINVMFLSAVWTLILTAPIHCRASIAEQVMWCYISPNLMKNTLILDVLDD